MDGAGAPGVQPGYIAAPGGAEGEGRRRLQSETAGQAFGRRPGSVGRGYGELELAAEVADKTELANRCSTGGNDPSIALDRQGGAEVAAPGDARL